MDTYIDFSFRKLAKATYPAASGSHTGSSTNNAVAASSTEGMLTARRCRALTAANHSHAP